MTYIQVTEKTGLWLNLIADPWYRLTYTVENWPVYPVSVYLVAEDDGEGEEEPTG